jgi:ribosomal protein L7/L12
MGRPADPRMAAITPEVVDLVRRGKKIQAIKLRRELTNLDLKTAKDAIDSL